MLTVLSLVTSVKDYIEIAHKLVETQSTNSLIYGSDKSIFLMDYNELGSVLTYVVLSIKEFLANLLSFSWLKTIWSLPLIVPDIASAMISEVSVLDSYFTNAFSFLETGLNSNSALNTMVTTENSFVYGFEKFLIGFLNSFFLFLPTSTSHLITLRRFVMQGLEAGYIAGLGTIAGNFLWLASIILGWRFIVIPWLSLDIFRYVLGFILLVKYLWDSSKDLNKTSNRTILEDNAKMKIFLLNFLLVLTEQTSIYPFISNISFGAEGSILEGFSSALFQGQNTFSFFGIHGCYLLGILLGSFSLLQFTVWFWENPAFSIYMWMVSSYRVSTSSYYKVLNFVFLYLTMLCAISSIPYFGLDYTITNPLGLIPQDRMIDQKLSTANGPGDKMLPETSFLNVNPTDKNSRTRDGVHARRERWKERLIKYQAFDTSLYDQGTYDILTIEDLNYGFDRFWLRRKMRNHQIRFRLFPGPWMRSLKKQLNKPGFTGPRVEFFRILFEQYYHPSFHATNSKKTISNKKGSNLIQSPTNTNLSLELTNKLLKPQSYLNTQRISGNTSEMNGATSSALVNNPNFDSLQSSQTKSLYALNRASDLLNTQNSNRQLLFSNDPSFSLNRVGYLGLKTFKTQKDFVTTQRYSALRKFARNLSNRINISTLDNTNFNTNYSSLSNKKIYSKSLKSLFSKIDSDYNKEKINIFRNISKNLLMPNNTNLDIAYLKNSIWQQNNNYIKNESNADKRIINRFTIDLKKTNIRAKLSKKDRLLLTYKTNLYNSNSNSSITLSNNNIIQPLNMYFQKDQAFKRKLKYYSTAVTRNLTVGNNAPYLKTMLKRAFYNYKPSLRWKRTMFTAAMRRGFRKKSIYPKKLNYTTTTLTTNGTQSNGMLNDSLNPINTNQYIYPSTTSYSVLGKRASRYRYQIYKDVLQHWYYTPFNRLLLKFDIDSFMNRQPKAHFVTKKEERQLHLRRLLLSEHYNTLRWYTYMQHYSTMKSHIGSTKSFANRVYNQQFQGTFKKIRHLFSITPSQGDMSVLKFDQILFNESNLNVNKSTNSLTTTILETNKQDTNIKAKSNTSKKTDGFTGLSSGSLFLPYSGLHEELATNEFSTQSNTNKDNNLNIDKTNDAKLRIRQPLPEDFIDQTMNITGQYLELQKAETNQKIRKYLNEKNYPELTKLLYVPQKPQSINETNLNATTDTKEILVQLLKECKRRLNDQTFLKNYVTHRIDKREQRNRETQKELASQLDNLKAWLSPINISTVDNVSSTFGQPVIQQMNGNDPTTTGLRKALNDGVYVLNNINPAIASKTLLTNQTVSLKFKGFSNPNMSIALQQSKINETLNSLKSLKNDLKFAKKTNLTVQNYTVIQKVMNTVLKPLLFIQHKVLMKRSEKNIEWWRQKQRAFGKRQSSRKKSRFKKIQEIVEQQAPISKLNDSRYLDSSSSFLTKTQFYQKPIGKSYANFQTLDITNSNREQLRKKVDKSEQNNNNNFTSLFKKIFTQRFSTILDQTNKMNPRFNKKGSSKGSRYRTYNMDRSRGFAYLKKPKKANNVFAMQDASGAEFNLVNTVDEGLLIDPTLSKKTLLKEVKARLAAAGAQKLTSNTADTTLTKEKLLNLKDLVKVATSKIYIKKAPGKKKIKRIWKYRKRHHFERSQQRYRKRKRGSLGKLRMLSKKLKRIQTSQELRNWWWNNYLPNYIQMNNIQNPSLESSVTKGYKPLSTTKALELASKQKSQFLVSSSTVISNSHLKPNFENDSEEQYSKNIKTQTNTFNEQTPTTFKSETIKNHLIDGIYEELFTNNSTNVNKYNVIENIYNTTNIPFYAGWDESLRKFVVTNRLLSRRDTGFEVDFNNIFGTNNLNSTASNKIQKSESLIQNKLEFTKAPLQGLNEGSFLYLQNEMPFNAYNIDQFIPNNQSFYAPLGWKRFQFRATQELLKTWLKANMNTSSNGETLSLNNVFLKDSTVSNLEFFNNISTTNTKFRTTQSLQNRRIKKRYKLLKQTPMQLMYLPSGALLTEILPSHYISVFDKQYRFPRNRYLKRNLLKASAFNKANTSNDISANSVLELNQGLYNTKDLAVLEFNKAISNQGINSINQQFTLRKRVKPRRKYHKKRFTKKDSLIFPRRRKFSQINSLENESKSTDSFRLRPSSKTKQMAMNKSKSKKRTPKANPVRLRQLRRREFQQIYKPLQRFQPRYGGFAWPGDYLRLDVIPMPKLQSLKEFNMSTSTSSISTNNTRARISKINVQPVGLLPRKYLIQKHNLKVLKKKLALSSFF